MASASDSTRTPSSGGLNHTRRQFLAAGALPAAAAVGSVVGLPIYRGTGPDLSAVAEGWLADAKTLGMWIVCGPDGALWRCSPLHDGAERAEDRERHWTKLHARPRLQRAVYALARRHE